MSETKTIEPEKQEGTPKQQKQQNEPKKQEGAPKEEAPKEKKPSPVRRLLPVIIIVVVAAIVGLVLWRTVWAKPDIPENLVVLSGRIEGDDSAVSPKTSGRIMELRPREGDKISAGEIIAILDDQQIRAQELAAQAAVVQAEARVRSAQAQIGVLQQQLNQSGVQVKQAKQDVAGRVAEAEAQLASAEAELAQQQASLELANFDRDAYVKLAASGAVSERQGRLATSTAQSQSALVESSKRRVDAARAAVQTARANFSNPELRTLEGVGVERQIAQQRAEVASAQAEANRARAQLSEAQANRADLVVRAPFAGTVATRTAEPGEVVSAGTSLVTLLDFTKVYLRGFVPEGEIGRVRVGQPARVYLDSAPEKPLAATISRIDPEATFTPENTYFRDDRVKQVVGVKLQLTEGTGFAKPGMPADGEILVQGTAWPEGKRKW